MLRRKASGMNRPGTGTLVPDFTGLSAALAEGSVRVDAALERLLPRAAGLQGRVQEAMCYAVFAGGKRLRPFLLMQSAGLFGVPPEQALRAAAAIECVHTY